jgi:hypothetical protein
MAPITRVAVIQLYPKVWHIYALRSQSSHVSLLSQATKPLDITHNHATAVKFIREAAKQGAHLAVLPEYHLTSWVPDDAAFADLAGLWESYLENYKVLAQELHICIAPGTIVQKVKDEKTGEYKLLNVATFISNDGSVLGTNLVECIVLSLCEKAAANIPVPKGATRKRIYGMNDTRR